MWNSKYNLENLVNQLAGVHADRADVVHRADADGLRLAFDVVGRALYASG